MRTATKHELIQTVFSKHYINLPLVSSHCQPKAHDIDDENVFEIHIFIRPSLDFVLWYGAVRPSVRPTVSTKKHRCKWRIFFKFCTQVCLGVPSINLLFVLSYLIKYAHNSIIIDFNIFGIHRVIF